ncbi:MAG TPA: aminoglycoside phosphotransferase family protein [Pseudonocardiaceae bacterium]
MGELREFTGRRGLREIERVGSGLEFTVFRALTPAGDPVVLRTPNGDRYQSNANDPLVDTRALLTWEHRITGWLTERGVPVARPLELALADNGPDVLVSAYVPDDGGPVDPGRLGALLAALHRLDATGLTPVAAGGGPASAVVVGRLVRRWATAATLADLPAPPPPNTLAGLLTGRPTGSLLHLDVRRPNLRCAGGAVSALLDWSNALVGDPLLELGRLVEFAWLPDNGLDLSALRDGYRAAGGHWPEDEPALLVHQLDAAVMLVLVFVSESPDPTAGRHAVDRLTQLHGELVSRT